MVYVNINITQMWLKVRKLVVKSEEVKNNEKLQEILDKTFRQLYEDYINSDNFKVDEINRLKKNNEEDNYYYIEKYKITAKNLINFFSL